MKDVLLFSGGVDSLVAYFYMNKPQPIYIDLQTKYSTKERKVINELEEMIDGIKTKIIEGINLGQFEQEKNAFVPHRNLILSAIASNYGDRIVLVGIEDDVCVDKSPEAFRTMSNCLTGISENRKIEVYSPFWNMSKSEVIKWGLQNVEGMEDLLRTSVSCYSTEGRNCGTCQSCLRKGVAMSVCGLNLDFFDNDIRRNPFIPQYIEAMKNGERYTSKRINESLGVFRKWGYKI